MSERLEKSMKEISVSVAKSQKEQEAQTREVLALREKVTVAIEQMEQMEGDMVSQEVPSKAGTVEAKIEKATQQRQVEVDALEKRVTANEDSIVKIKEDIELAHEDVDEMMQILKEVNAAQQEIA